MHIRNRGVLFLSISNLLFWGKAMTTTGDNGGRRKRHDGAEYGLGSLGECWKRKQKNNLLVRVGFMIERPRSIVGGSDLSGNEING